MKSLFAAAAVALTASSTFAREVQSHALSDAVAKRFETALTPRADDTISVFDIAMCDGTGTLVITTQADAFRKATEGLVESAKYDPFGSERLEALLNTGLCAQPGPHAGAWLLAGTQRP